MARDKRIGQKTMDENLIGTGIRLPKSHIEQLDRIAASKRVSRNVVILWALDAYLAPFFAPVRLSEKTNGDGESQPAETVN